MIITRTPFRVTLGGGGTDLPSYYSRFGGFIFSFALDKYITSFFEFATTLTRLGLSGSLISKVGKTMSA